MALFFGETASATPVFRELIQSEMAVHGFDDLSMAEKLELFVSTKVKKLLQSVEEAARAMDGGYVRGGGGCEQGLDLELMMENLHVKPTSLSILVFVQLRIIAPTLAFILNKMATHLR